MKGLKKAVLIIGAILLVFFTFKQVNYFKFKKRENEVLEYLISEAGYIRDDILCIDGAYSKGSDGAGMPINDIFKETPKVIHSFIKRDGKIILFEKMPKPKKYEENIS